MSRLTLTYLHMPGRFFADGEDGAWEVNSPRSLHPKSAPVPRSRDPNHRGVSTKAHTPATGCHDKPEQRGEFQPGIPSALEDQILLASDNRIGQ